MDSLSTDQILTLMNTLQVRHVIPVHLANNSFGGAAVYDDNFNTNTYFLNRSFYELAPDKCLSYTLGWPQRLESGGLGALQPAPIAAGLFFNLIPPMYDFGPHAGGHRNRKSLNEAAFRDLMEAGLLLDIVHMGETTADAALTLGEKFHYPLMDSHTGLRNDDVCSVCQPPNICPPPDDGLFKVNERSVPYSHVRRIRGLGGVLGLGTSGHATDQDPVGKWLKNYTRALTIMNGKGVGLGTDTNGLSPQIPFDNIPTVTGPNYSITVASKFAPSAAVTTDPLPKYTLASKSYDFQTDGIATYGLLPDFIQAVSLRSGSAGVVNALYRSAEDVIQMWEKAVAAAPKPEPITCSVMDDGYSNVAGPSDAVYIRSYMMQACIPGPPPSGTCRKWFGRCFTTQTKVPVFFSTFDDGYINLQGVSDAVYINAPPSSIVACIPTDSSTGACHKWFGRGVTQDGRQVRCRVFDDGYTNLTGTSDAVYILDAVKSCVHTDALDSPNGICRKWFGRCEAWQK